MTSRKFIYIPHALERMAQRHISRSQVENAVLDPQKLSQNPDTLRWTADRDTTAGNFIRVVYAEGPDGVEIITTVITAIRISQRRKP